MPIQPAKNRCWTPPRATYCAARNRTSACAAVRRIPLDLRPFRPDHREVVLELRQLAAAGHQPGELLEVDLRLLVGAEARAPVQDHEAVADRVGVVRVVRD